MSLTVHLASSSPRRQQILETLGIRFTAAGVDIDEARRGDETVDDMVVRLAAAKVQASRRSVTSGVPVIGADTAVALDDRVLGKPGSRDEAIEMLSCLSGRTHRVLTGVALEYRGSLSTVKSISAVRFRRIGPDEAAAYWRSGEPRDKAGAYAVQGLGGVFVEALHGSYSGVVGLPVFELAELLKNAGLNIWPAKPARPHG